MNTKLSRHWMARTIDSALLVLLPTAGSYGIAFEYQEGYLRHFGVPSDFVQVGVRELLTGGVALLFSLAVVLCVVNFALRLLPEKGRMISPRSRFRMVSLAIFLVFLLMALRAMGAPLTVYLAYGTALALALALAMELHSAERNHAAQPLIIDNDFFRRAIRFLGRNPASLIMTVILVGLFSNLLGGLDARERGTFLVPAEGPCDLPSCVVIKPLSQGFLCVGFDAKTRRAGGELPAGGKYPVGSGYPDGSEYLFIKPEGAKLRRCYIRPLKQAWHMVGDSEQ